MLLHASLGHERTQECPKGVRKSNFSHLLAHESDTLELSLAGCVALKITRRNSRASQHAIQQQQVRRALPRHRYPEEAPAPIDRSGARSIAYCRWPAFQ